VTMRKAFLLTLVSVAIAGPASAQNAPTQLRLTVDEAVRMALDHNVDLQADRLDPQISDTRLAAAPRAVRPTLTSRVDRNQQLECLVHTVASVKTGYWNLVSARANVNARQSALDLAQELVRVNKAKVDVGQTPPLDLVSAQAEVAADQEQLIIAQTAVRQAED